MTRPDWLDDIDRTPATASPRELGRRLQRAFTATELAVAVSTLPTRYLVAVVSALDVVRVRDDDIALANFSGGRYHRRYPLGGPTEIERHRYPPDGDRWRWVLEGPPCHVNFPGRGGTGAAA